MGYLKAGGIALGLALLVYSYWYAFDAGRETATAQCKAETEGATVKALDNSIKGAADANKKLQGQTDKIIKDYDGSLAPVLLNQLERMRNH